MSCIKLLLLVLCICVGVYSMLDNLLSVDSKGNWTEVASAYDGGSVCLRLCPPAILQSDHRTNPRLTTEQ